MRSHVTFSDKTEWLDARTRNINSTESPALFGLSPYSTEYELWHEKSGKQPGAIEENERMTWGKRLEPVIARGVAEDHGWTVRAMNRYVTLNQSRMGSSFDFEIVAHDKGPGILEVKNVDYVQFKATWTEYDDGFIEAPPHIEIQLQHQLHVVGRSWGVIVVLIGGNTPIVLIRDRDEDVGQSIERKIMAFWSSVDEGKEPEPDFARDASLIMKLNRNANPDSVYGVSEDDHVDSLIRQYHQANSASKDAKKKADALKAEIITHIGDAGRVVGNGYSIATGTTKDTPPRVLEITEDMVGEEITLSKGRKGYRMFRFKETKS